MNHPAPLILLASPRMQRTPAFERATAQALSSGARLLIVAVDYIRSLEMLGLFDHEALHTLRDSYLNDHRHWLENEAVYERSRGVDCSVHVLWSERIFEEVNEYIARVRPAMLIKDVHHEPLLQRIFSTPLDWHLLRDCPCPVQWVKRSADVLPRKVLAAVNLYRTEHAELGLNDRIVETAWQLASQYGARVDVVYSYDWSAIYTSGITVVGALPIETGFCEALGEAHAEALASLCDRHGIAPACRHFLSGPPLRTIDTFARQNDCDLLVLGVLPGHHLSRVPGDTAQALLERAPCSVLAIKPDDTRPASPETLPGQRPPAVAP